MDTPEAEGQPVVVKRKKRRRRIKATDSAFDHVWPWAVSSIAIVFVLALSVATEMMGFFIVVVIGVAFLLLCGLLTLRLALCRLWKRAPDLRLTPNWQLKGPLAMVLPPGLLLMVIFAREMGVIDMGLYGGTVTFSYKTNVSSQTPAPPQFREAPSLRLPRGYGSFVVAFNEALAPLGAHVIGGSIEVECDPPRSYLPLFKSATTAFVINARLLRDRTSFQFEIKGTAEGSISGFAASSVLPATVGRAIGANVRGNILARIK